MIVKKEAHPLKINRTKPSSSKKLERIKERRSEKIAEWRLRKEQETMATQSSHDESIATQPSPESMDESMCGDIALGDHPELRAP